MILAVTVLIIGALLGCRFKVFVLVPAVIVLSVTTIWSGMAHSDNLSSIFFVMATTITALQVGYLGATMICWPKKSFRPLLSGASRQMVRHSTVPAPKSNNRAPA